jgi:hypothetical protein
MNLMMLLEMASIGFGDAVALGPRDGAGLTTSSCSTGRALRRRTSRARVSSGSAWSTS